MTHRGVTDRDAHLADHQSRDLTGTRADWPRSDKTVPLDHNEAFGPMQPANLMVIADHFTERAGGRPHTYREASALIRYAAGRAGRSVSSWMSTAIFVRADECCRL